MDDKVFASMPPMRESTEEAILDMIPVVLWYRSTKKGKEYWCNRCGAHETIDKTERTSTPADREILYGGHKYEAHCPACKRLGQMACIGRVRNPRRYNAVGYALVVSPAEENEVWMREVCVSYYPGCWNGEEKKHEVIPYTSVKMRDMVRYHLTPGKAEEYDYRYGGWTKLSEIQDATRVPYPWVLDGVNTGSRTRVLVEGDLADTFMRYNAYKKIKKWWGGGNIACYLANYAMYPTIEMMVKSGFEGIVYDLVVNRNKNKSVVDWTQTDPRKAFGLTRDLLNKLQTSSNQPMMLKEYHRYRRRGEKDPWHCAELIWQWRPSYGVMEWRETLKKCGATEIELYKYFEKIKKENPGCHMAVPPPVDQTWRDYIAAARDIGYDLTQKTVVMPKDLYGKHDDAVALRNEMRPRQIPGYGGKTTEKIKEAFAERAPKLAAKYAKTGAEYFIRIPQTPKEIIYEGQKLGHCVGGYHYIKNHAEGRNPILFLRRTNDPDTPFYTMEIQASTNEILQCEGCKSADGHGKYGHIHREDLPEEAKAFLEEWEAERVKKNKSDKETKTA